MRIVFLTFFAILATANAAMGQSRAFINQAPAGNSVSSGVTAVSSGVFVQQVPIDSRIKTSIQRQPEHSFVVKEFILPKTVGGAEDESLIVYEDVGLMPYAEGKTPELPVVSTGTTVILRSTGPGSALPSIGLGAVRI